MGYTLPLRFIRVSTKSSDNDRFDVAICATRIVAIMSTETYQARRTLKEERKSGTLINACGREAAKSVVFLDNGSVVASPLSVRTLMVAIERSNFKKSDTRKVAERVRLKVYDVEDEEPDEENDIEVDDVSCDYGSKNEEDELVDIEDSEFLE